MSGRMFRRHRVGPFSTPSAVLRQIGETQRHVPGAIVYHELPTAASGATWESEIEFSLVDPADGHLFGRSRITLGEFARAAMSLGATRAALDAVAVAS